MGVRVRLTVRHPGDRRGGEKMDWGLENPDSGRENGRENGGLQVIIEGIT